MSVKIAMIGCGKLGRSCGEVMSKMHDVVGFDINPHTSCSFPCTRSIQEAITDRDIIFIAVPTPHNKEYGGEKPTHHLPPKDFDYTAVRSVVSEINKFVKKKQTVVLISTVLPGTVRREIAPLLTKTCLIYNPYLIAIDSVREDLIDPDCLIIGVETGKCTLQVKRLIEFYNSFIIKKNVPVNIGTWEEAESIKIFYNTFISFKLAFVNMIQDVAEYVGNMNVDVVTTALKTSTKRIVSQRYMNAGMGDGGACHPRDNIALRFLSQKAKLGYDFFQNIVITRDKQAKNIAEFVTRVAIQHNNDVVMHGISYKPNTCYTDGSYSLLIKSFLEKNNIRTCVIDPYVHQCDAVQYDIHSRKPHIIFLSHSIKIDKDLFCVFPKNSIIIDPWRTFKSKRYKVLQYGNTKNKRI
jgi:UDPglucose 6-dehydrogenase